MGTREFTRESSWLVALRYCKELQFWGSEYFLTTFSIKTVVVANFNSFSSEVVDYMFQGTTGIRLET